MSGWFEEHLDELIPDHYWNQGGDFRAFLKLFIDELDNSKKLTDDFPKLFDVSSCSEMTLPFLGSLVCINIDGKNDPNTERRKIQEAVPKYRRKGTLPALRRDLQAIGWNGSITETYKKAIRLNLRARLNRAKLDGFINGHGVYEITSTNHVPEVREIERFHHPAGTKVFWYQQFVNEINIVNRIEVFSNVSIRSIVYTSASERIQLNHSVLNRGHNLTQKQKVWADSLLVSVVEVGLTIESSSVRLSRWNGRQNRLELNSKKLNIWSFPNTWESEHKHIEWHKIRTKTPKSKFLRLGRGGLNQNPLPLSLKDQYVLFKQKDFITESLVRDVVSLGDIVTLEVGSRELLQRSLRLNESPLHSSSLWAMGHDSDFTVLQ